MRETSRRKREAKAMKTNNSWEDNVWNVKKLIQTAKVSRSAGYSNLRPSLCRARSCHKEASWFLAQNRNRCRLRGDRVPVAENLSHAGTGNVTDACIRIVSTLMPNQEDGQGMFAPAAEVEEGTDKPTEVRRQQSSDQKMVLGRVQELQRVQEFNI